MKKIIHELGYQSIQIPTGVTAFSIYEIYVDEGTNRQKDGRTDRQTELNG